MIWRENYMPNRKLGTLMALAACLVMALGAIAVPVQAAIPDNGHVHLLNDGRTSANATTQFEFYVEIPYSLGLDADYWNLTVYAHPVLATATNATYHIHYYIYDGATNITKIATMAAKNDKDVYANISFAAADYAAVVSGEATVYVVLQDTGHSTLDHYDATVSIVENDYAAQLINVMMLIIPVILMVVLITWIMDSMGLIGKMFEK